MENYAKVDAYHPFVGLDNSICKNPRHYCTLHDVWLSEYDSKKRHCKTCNREKPGTPCPSFKKNHYNKNIEKLLRKSKPIKDKSKKKDIIQLNKKSTY